MITGGRGTAHTGGSPIPSVVSGKLCGSLFALQEEAMWWHWLIVLVSTLGCVACSSVISPLLAPREMYLWLEGDGGLPLLHFGFGVGFSKSL
jgi:hypothetical protein